MRICIVSDVHYKFCGLGPEDQARQAKIISFFRTLIGNCEILVLNGDIFDLWTESRHTIIKEYFPMLKVLADIQESGTRLIYISGNHDFWFGTFFRDIIKAELHDKQCVLNVDNRRILIAHGDLFTVNDTRYKIFRWLIRTGFVRTFYNVLHPDFALELGSKMSRNSRKKRIPGEGHKRRCSGLQNYARKMLSDARYDFVVFGHSHEPELTQMHHGYYANSGDWLKHYNYVNIIDGNIEIRQYEPQ